MSFTLQSSPSAVYSAVYNPIYFKVLSSLVAQPNFKYVFQVFTGSTTTGTPLSTIKLLPRPDTTCIFSPARILESQISYDTNIQNITTGTSAIYHSSKFIVDFGVEYGSLTTGTTLYSAQTTSTKYYFNGVLQYDEVPSWPTTFTSNYYITTPKFLTNQPRSGVYIKNTTDRGTLSVFQASDIAWTNIQVETYHNAGGTSITNLAIPTSAITATTLHIPSGIYNINAASANTISITNDWKYTVRVDGYLPYLEGNITGESITYLIDTNCSKYDTLRFQFKNSLGGFDYENMYLINRKKLSVKRNTFTKPLAYNYAVGDIGKQILDIDAQYTNTIQSRVLTYAESIWLQELMWSSFVNLIDENGVSTPIIIDTDSIDLKPKSYNNKLYSITVNFSYANKINTSR